ncbi:hypothetical protein [Vampirovibrio sp.]|uniref:hypothetical protein n=1 Tax=Vampirovibrio sp. TaxID=2717857 RepID=UPI0035945100
MTRLFKESENQLDPLAWSAFGHGWAPLFNDFRETFHDFWEQTIYPVFHMIGQTCVILWGQALLPAIHNRLTYTQTRLTHLASGKKKRKKEAVLLLEATEPIRLQKIHGALGERWSADTTKDERPIRLSVNKSNPWIAAQKRTVTVIPGHRKTPVVSLGLKDDIRGLDDIFTTPIQGSFLDVVTSSGRSSKPKPALGEEKTHSKSVARAKPEAASNATTGELSRMAVLAQTQEVLRQEALKLGSRVKNIAESTEDWFNREAPDRVRLSIQLNEKSPIPYHSYSLYSLEVAPVFAPSASAALPDICLETPMAQHSLSSNRVSEQPNLPPEAIGLEAPQKRASQKAKPAELSYELVDDLNGLGYMAQNNRILSNSISNLVDRYFHQASLEEESNYY